MKLELKSIHFSEHLSEETNAFTADLWVDGKKVGYCKNDGQGGSTYIWHYEGMREKLREAEAYAKTLPDVKWNDHSFKMNLEFWVDETLSKWIENKQRAKDFNKGIVYTTPAGKEMITTWKGWSISKLLKHPQGRATVYNAILRHKKEGNTILSTNLGTLLS